MDDKDRLLLTLLRRDARRPVVALARDLGLSRTATQDRLAKLKTSGAIVGFTVVESGVEAQEAAYLTVKLAPGFRCADLVPKLSRIPALETIHSVSGAVDMIIRAAAGNVGGIEAVRAAIADTAGVAEVSTYVVLDRYVA